MNGDEYWFKEAIEAIAKSGKDTKEAILAHDAKVGEQHKDIFGEIHGMKRDYNKFLYIIIAILAAALGVKLTGIL